MKRLILPTQAAKMAARDALALAETVAAAAYDVALDAAGIDREAVAAATAQYEATQTAARRAYNDVMYPGVFE